MLQLFVVVFGAVEGEFFYTQVIKLATLVSALPQYTLHTFSQALTLYYRRVVKIPLAQCFDQECHYLYQCLMMLMVKMGARELYDKVLFYVESYTHLTQQMNMMRPVKSGDGHNEFTVTEVIGKTIQNIF